MGRIKILIFVLLFYGCCRPLQLIEKWRTEALFLNQEEGYAARISSWDRTGGNIDYIRLAPGETVTLAEISGAGVIRHIWMTFNAREPMGRLLVLRMYWDGAQQPAVEVPIGDFFGVGNGMLAEVNSFPITVSSRGRALNCWWQMPFAKGAKITITNEGYEPINTFYYYIDYLALKTSPGTKERFYAQYRQAYPASSLENYLILETSGRGRYVGTVLSVESTKPDWWGEGDELICVDNREPLRGTGTEDYFCYAWGMKPNSTLWHGSPVCEGYDAPGLRTTMYRFHILDPIPFQKHISVSIEHGTNNNRADNLFSVAFWYQVPPATTFPQLPAAAERLVGKSRTKFIRQQLWHLTINKAPDLSTKLEELLPQVKDEENVYLFKGLQAYADGVRELNEEAVVNMEFYLGLLKGLIEAQPAGERYTSPTIEAATDDDSPVPGSTVEAYRMVERLKFDLQRQIELKRGFKPGDEIVIEVLDSQGRLTPSPLYEDTMDFTNSITTAGTTGDFKTEPQSMAFVRNLSLSGGTKSGTRKHNTKCCAGYKTSKQ